MKKQDINTDWALLAGGNPFTKVWQLWAFVGFIILLIGYLIYIS